MKNTKLPTREEQLEYLRNLPDDCIDTSDIPEITDFSSFTVGKFYKPIKQSVTLRVDADILDWFKKNNPKYQSAMNAALRQFVLQQH